MVENQVAREVLNYEELVREYNASLAEILRHHQSVGALEIWVPDDDPTKSILNMVEAAEITGLPELCVRVGAETAPAFDANAFREAAGSIGHVDVRPDGDALIVSVTGIGGAAAQAPRAAGSDWFGSVGEVYREAIRIAAGRIAHEGPLDVPFGSTAFSAERDGVTLAIAVDSRHTITAAAHEGTTLRPDRAVMDTLCGLLPGLTVQEASDHAIASLELGLRSQRVRPVEGIVLPENADPVFGRPLALIREIWAAYTAAHAEYTPGRNTFTPRVADGWVTLPREEKIARLQRAIDEAAPEIGLRPGDIRVLEVEMHVRVTVVFHEQVEVERKPKALMDVERILRRRLEPSLQIFSIELKDASKLRRL